MKLLVILFLIKLYARKNIFNLSVNIIPFEPSTIPVSCTFFVVRCTNALLAIQIEKI